MPAPVERDSRSLFGEAFRVFGAVLLAVIVLALVAGWVPLVADFLYALVALIFIVVPQRILEKSEEDPEDFGLTRREPLKALAWGALFTVVTLPFFAVGFWVWEVQVLDREVNVDLDHYWQWPLEIEGAPRSWGVDTAGVWIWSTKDKLHIGLRNARERNNQVTVEGARAFRVETRGAVKAVALGDSTQLAKRWSLSLTSSRGRGVATLIGAPNAKVSVAPVVKGAATWPIRVGPRQETIEDSRWNSSRSLWWIALWLATQFLLIALPEEYFYRGYLQTRLQQAFEARASEQGKTPWSWLGFTPAIVLTSILFGLGHLFVPVGGTLLANRMSVFFPALLFGWLRVRTQSIGASIFYHACSNLMVLFAAVHFS